MQTITIKMVIFIGNKFYKIKITQKEILILIIIITELTNIIQIEIPIKTVNYIYLMLT